MNKEIKRKETVDSKLRTAWQTVSRMYNAEASHYGGTVAIVHFILNIDSKEGSYASDIAPLIGMEGSSLSRTIQKLENRKMIIKKHDSKDKRKVRLILTDLGKEHKELAKNTVKEFNMSIEKIIGAEKKEEFFNILNLITKQAEERLIKSK